MRTMHLFLALIGSAAAAANAAPLQGSGPHLPLPDPFGIVDERIRPTYSPIPGTPSFSGTWAAPVLSPWQGSFLAFGPNPVISQGQTGTTNFSFLGLNAGFLPSGTGIEIGDLDGGSGSGERFTLRAADPNGAAILSPWLNVPGFVWGPGNGPGGAILPTDTAGWSFADGVYTFVGDTVLGGNPTISLTMDTNINIGFMQVVRDSGFAGLGFVAPVPAPGAGVLLAAGGLIAAARRRN